MVIPHNLNKRGWIIRMAGRFAQLKNIIGTDEITKEFHYEFLFHLEGAILLALREQGRLNPMQYRHAEEKLKQQRRDRAKNILEKGEAI